MKLYKGIFTLLVSLLTLISQVDADIYQSGNMGGGQMDLFFRGFVTENLTGNANTVSVDVTAAFDWSESTATIQSFNLAYSGETFLLTRNYTVGPGQVKTINAYVRVDPFSLSADSLPSYSLTAENDGRYSAYQLNSAKLQSLPLSGTVLIEGPTESISIPFALSIPVSANVGFPPVLGVETAGYPQSVVLDHYGENLSYWYVPSVQEPWDLAQATIDGIDVNLSTIGGKSTRTGDFSMQVIPEPSSLALVSVAGVIIHFARKRLKR